MNTKLLINGKLTAGAGSKEDVLDPATGAKIATVAEASEGQVDNAVKSAQKAFAGWSATVPKDRATLLLKVADRIEAEAAEFAEIESRNCGKPYNAVLNDEIPAIADVFRFFAGAARTMHGSAAGEYLPGFTSMIRRDPIGVVASIAPWNYPLMMAAWKLSPALAGGNTVVIKPSEQTPLSTLKLATILAELFPAGVVNVVCGRGSTVGAPLTTDSRSASSNTITGALPPSSRCVRLVPFAAACRTLSPVETSPVSEIIATPGCEISGAPTVLPRPQTTLTTPAGNSSARIVASFNVDSGVCSEGLITTVLPPASAGESFQAAIISG